MPDTLLALVPRSNLSVVLTAFHRGGFGHVVRVLDPERSPMASQLRRAGVDEARLTEVGADQVVVFVPAPQRAPQAAALAMASGAADVEVVTRGVATSESVAPGLIAQAGNRRDRRATRRIFAASQAAEPADAVAD